jgi:predicted PilT family ATPase
MTSEERQRQMDFILEHQVQFAVNMQRLEEADARAGKRIDRLERVLGLAIRANQRGRKETKEKFNALIAAQTRTEDAVAKLAESQAQLAESQAHADKRLDALIDIVQGGKQ